MANQHQHKQSIDQLTQRYEKLNEDRITAEANLNNAEKSLTDLKRQARDEYGTDDLGELRKILKTMEKENEEKRAEYQEALDEIEKDLEQVHLSYQNLENKPSASKGEDE